MDNQENSKETQKNYELNFEAVESLANADKEEIPQYSEEELYKYRKKKFQIPDALKILFIKFWFPGAVCFFFVMGISSLVGLDQFVVLSMVLGMVTDLLTNNVIRFMEPYSGANDKWLLVTKRGMVGFGLNLFFGCLITFAVYICYGLINMIVKVSVEPLLFGLLYMGVDMLLLGIKRLCTSIIKDAKTAARDESADGSEE